MVDLAHFICQYADTFLDNARLLRVGHAQALLLMWVWLCEAEEEVVPGYDEDAAGFEALVESLACNGEIREAEPEKEGTFWAMDFHRSIRLLKGVSEPLDGLISTSLV